MGGRRIGRRPVRLPGPDNPDRVVGFEVDLKDALQRELGRPIQFKHYDFKSLIPGLQRGDFDFAMNGLEVLPEYQEASAVQPAVLRLQAPTRRAARANGVSPPSKS